MKREDDRNTCSLWLEITWNYIAGILINQMPIWKLFPFLWSEGGISGQEETEG